MPESLLPRAENHWASSVALLVGSGDLNKHIGTRECCELSFIWGKMRTAARETTFQITLRNCPDI